MKNATTDTPTVNAAAKREGVNAAKMREALAETTERLIRIVGCDHYEFHRNEYHCDFKTSMGECRNKSICETIFKAQSALAAPPRNCDRPECATIDGMVSAHEEFCISWHEAGNSCARCPHNQKSRTMTCREVWLIAPAEKGADA